MSANKDLVDNLVEYIERMEEVQLQNCQPISAHLEAALQEAAKRSRPHWQTPDMAKPPLGSFVAFITDGCDFELGNYQHDDILERTIWLSTKGNAYTDLQIRTWLCLPDLPAGHPCEGVVMSRQDKDVS